jgi:hypothetical protein
MGEMRNVYEILVEEPEGRFHLKDLLVDERLILEWTLGKQDENLWTGFIWLRIGTNVGLW